MEPVEGTQPRETRFPALGFVLFWTYNGLWLVFGCVLLGLLIPVALWNELPWKLLLILVGIGLVPAPLMMWGARLGSPNRESSSTLFDARDIAMQDRSARLLRLLYGVELPVQGLLFLALLFLRQATPAIWFLTFSVVLAVSGLMVLTISETKARPSRAWILLASQAIGLSLALYVLVLSAFFMPIVLVPVSAELHWSFFVALLHPLLWCPAYSFLNGLISPFAATAVYFASFRRQFRVVARRTGPWRTAAAIGALCVALVAVAVALAWQPSDARLRALLQRYRDARTFEERQAAARALEPEMPALRRLLVAQYLAPYRYVTDAEALRTLYRDRAVNHGFWAGRVYDAVTQMTAPFVYRGRFQEDARWAIDAYAEVFDEGIQNGEHTTIETTLRDTFTQDELRAGLLDRYRKAVRVVSQQVQARLDGGAVIVTIQEEYENTTNEPQEVLYEFSLPDSAVVTGLWLGPDLEFEGVLAARGAARTVYEAEVVRSQDPALLEQTGPRQYRLRVFPVPVRTSGATPGPVASPAKRLKASFRYALLGQSEADAILVALPRLHESRNVFWDGRLESRIAGAALHAQPGADPPSARATDQAPEPTVEHWSAGTMLRLYAGAPLPAEGVFQIGDATLILTSLGRSTPDRVGSLLSGRKIALLLDASHSSAGRDWRRTLEADPHFEELVSNNRVDGFFFDEGLGPAIPLGQASWGERLPGIVCMGRTRLMDALHPLCSQDYDFWIVLTDGGGLGDGQLPEACDTPPLAIVHLDRRVPPYTDALSRRVLKGGGVFTTLGAALRNFAYARPGPIPVTATHAVEVRRNDLNPTRGDSCDTDRPLCQVLTRQLALTEYAAAEADGAGVPVTPALEALHGLAQAYHLITPSSSLIALVEDRQREALEEESQGKDAFAPAASGTEEQLEAPSGQGLLNVQAVPEPEMWALLACATVILGLYAWRQRVL